VGRTVGTTRAAGVAAPRAKAVYTRRYDEQTPIIRLLPFLEYCITRTL